MQWLLRHVYSKHEAGAGLLQVLSLARHQVQLAAAQQSSAGPNDAANGTSPAGAGGSSAGRLTSSGTAAPGASGARLVALTPTGTERRSLAETNADAPAFTGAPGSHRVPQIRTCVCTCCRAVRCTRTEACPSSCQVHLSLDLKCPCNANSLKQPGALHGSCRPRERPERAPGGILLCCQRTAQPLDPRRRLRRRSQR